MRRYLVSEPSNVLKASILVTIALYACLLGARLVLSAPLLQKMDIAFIPGVFILALTFRLVIGRRSR